MHLGLKWGVQGLGLRVGSLGLKYAGREAARVFGLLYLNLHIQQHV